jgi:hypothetical protein
MKKFKVEQVKSEMDILIDMIKDDEYQYTPEKIRREMVASISGELDKKVLVIRNLEFIETLCNGAGFSVENIYYSAPSQVMKEIAIFMGIPENQVFDLEYNKEVDLGTDMKFDIIIQNPPYNPNSLWKKFVTKAISQLTEDGKMVVIHPDSWRINGNHLKFQNDLKRHLVELHMMQYSVWEHEVATSVDWYVYSPNIQETCKVVYPNGQTESLDLSKEFRIHKFPKNSVQLSILNKITNSSINNGVMCLKGWDGGTHPDVEGGQYLQCGGVGKGTSWTIGDFGTTEHPTKHQFENKVVMSYAGKPRAKSFSSEDAVGVIKASYWLTDDLDLDSQSLCLLLNSKMYWKLICALNDPDEGKWKPYGTIAGIPLWYIRELKINGLFAQTEDEVYEHFGLTQEEIDWINE